MRRSILWTRLDRPGHEAARLVETAQINELSGAAVFVEDAVPVSLRYRIVCGEDWATRSVTVRGWIGESDVSIDIAVSLGEWSLNGSPVPAVAGCADVDLHFSPSTNLLPIRRLQLGVGQSAAVRAAWLRFPSFELEVLEQTYSRVERDLYRYESAGGRFTAELRVNEAGFPVDYAGVWRAV
ncbi:MAG TPA: putative glycolipid-binding domain-containing protein [Thermoanaerobaculia bacterium]|nr:putative glycolipid-binding domain-containing protein [Thermoanaerobaculia bacterium]